MFRFVSPERRWRAGALVLLAAWFGWRSFRYAGLPRYLGPVTGGVLILYLLAAAVLVMRECLVVTGEGVADRRALRTVRVPWPQISEFRVARPGALWGGYCVVAERRDGGHVDLLSTRAYSRTASSRHLDELYRLCWTLEEYLAGRD
jgi:PH (Pleckstrin Homology) domain-containing protein